MISFDITRSQGELVLAVTGDVDLDTADTLREAVLDTFAENPRQVHVDLSGVAFLNSSGLSALLAGLKEAKSREVEYAVVGAQASVRKVIEMVGLTEVLTEGDR